MTDTLADSRTSPRDFAAGVPLVVEDVPRRSVAERTRQLEDPGFGRYFTDSMVVARYRVGQGWVDARLTAYAPLQLDPSAAALHYAQSIFEGLKAYAQPDGSVATFRPESNAARFARSAARLAMPEVPAESFLAAVDALVDADRDWVPTGPDQTLYIRPYMLAVEPFLGVRPAHEYLFIVIASPAGAYFPRGVHPVSVYLSEDYIRAAPGGTGDVKCAGNYAASLLAQEQAIAAGCDQVVWLDAVEKRYVEEMGGMNLFFVLGAGADAELVTPELTGTLLPGITRESLITVARELGHPVTERKFSVDEWRAGVADGSITETFACGTAAVITPVGEVKARTGDFTVGTGEPGPLTMQLRAHLLDVQHGRVSDSHGWLHGVAPAAS
ncbi:MULTISPECIES: branched-chain amino acid aminotransferase [unclassified Modestobacter]|uniref:branched-chain amino acid aminotransferase n=1 Tax=unclassified Modestobacter TaxID=2643866 RepID=UPI0022AB1F23|nr:MULTISPECIES: branched-chain amino acid aminotransferase [unclassified Modestobacter]MCZ2824140.1 branched-chain amino acid aminotransferase [Modestobacter sp. VKM Ac-2981]MCZ2852385.1 branched-chain amino acid aminotransferase [Modestobacter sp. VKM Ac-2982]